MTFADAVRACFAKFLTFSGRASRAEYWFFFLFIVIWYAIAAIIDWRYFTSVVGAEADGVTTVTVESAQPVQSIVGLVVFVPHLAAAWRRMHDTGRSGLFALLPILLTVAAATIMVFGVGIADLFASGGRLDILFTRLTALVVIPTLLILLISPLLVLWWLSRPGQPGAN